MEQIEHASLFMVPNFFQFLHLPGLERPFLPDHVTMAWVVMAILAVTGYLATRRLQPVPEGAQNVLEVLIEAFHGVLDGIIGPTGRRYLPLIGSLGLFIVVGNLLGLVPGFKSPTANINTTAALAIITFLAYHYFGIREQGALAYLKHFTGPVWWLAPMMVPIEIIGHLARPISLTIRLFGNIFGEDTVILFLFFLVPLIAPLPMMGLAIFTSLVQALVWVMLSTIYIAGAVAHEEH